jgi:type II secretory pathway component PulF
VVDEQERQEYKVSNICSRLSQANDHNAKMNETRTKLLSVSFYVMMVVVMASFLMLIFGS